MAHSLRILHLAIDEKFIDQAYRVFEEVAPGLNDIFLYSREAPKYTRTPPRQIFSRAVEFFGVPAATLSRYGLVVVHSLHQVWWRTILKVPESIPVLWLGWGYDYYDLMDGGEDVLLLPRTKAATRQYAIERKSLPARAKKFIRRLFLDLKKDDVIGRVNYFSPVLPAEHRRIEMARAWKHFPRRVRWNYGNLEDDLIRGGRSAVISGFNILVGNSATPTNNHLEAFELLLDIVQGQDQERKVIVPLSYGASDYRTVVMEEGKRIFSDRFWPLTDFIPIDEYVGIVSSCSHVVMNHVRQQALGNIIIMLYLGAKVFVREESPIYAFFKDEGVHIFSIQELQQERSLLNERLTPDEIQKNRSAVLRGWSRQVSQRRTRELLECIFAGQ